MTRFRSRAFFVPLLLVLTGCAHSSGMPVAAIAEPAIADAFISLLKPIHLGIDHEAGAGVAIASGVAVTNGHNANLVDPKLVIGQSGNYDLLYFHTSHTATLAAGEPVLGTAVTAYGAGVKGDIRIAHGMVRQIVTCADCTAPAYFVFSNDRKGADDAGPGFSGGPVLDSVGRLVGIVFGYKDEGPQRRIYAYDMARVRAELSALQKQGLEGQK